MKKLKTVKHLYTGRDVRPPLDPDESVYYTDLGT